MSQRLLHKISDLITIEETIGGNNSQRGDRIMIGSHSFPVPGTPHKLSLYEDNKFVCSVSFACYEQDAEKYRQEYIKALIDVLEK